MINIKTLIKKIPTLKNLLGKYVGMASHWCILEFNNNAITTFSFGHPFNILLRIETTLYGQFVT